MDCSMPGFSVLHHLLEFAQSCPLSPSCYLTTSSSAAVFSFALNLSQHPGIFQWVGSLAVHIRWPKYWSFSLSIIGPSSKYSGLISFRTDWFDLLAVQGTLKSLLQYHHLLSYIPLNAPHFLMNLCLCFSHWLEYLLLFLVRVHLLCQTSLIISFPPTKILFSTVY